MANIKAEKGDESAVSSSAIELESRFTARMELCAQRVGSVSALAKKAGVSQSGIRRYFNGGEPTRPHLIGLARAAGVSVEWLATGAGTPDQGLGQPDSPEQPVDRGVEMDLDLLEKVARVTFQELEARGLRLDPAGQARMVRVLYRHFARQHQPPDQETVSNLIDLAAYR